MSNQDQFEPFEEDFELTKPIYVVSVTCYDENGNVVQKGDISSFDDAQDAIKFCSTISWRHFVYRNTAVVVFEVTQVTEADETFDTPAIHFESYTVQ